LAFLNGLLNPQTYDRTPWLGDQSKHYITYPPKFKKSRWSHLWL